MSKKSVIKTILAFLVLCGSFSGMAFASEIDDDKNLIAGETYAEECEMLADEDLLEGYIERIFYPELRDEMAVYGNVGETKLTPTAKQAYTVLKNEIAAIASGKKTSTQVAFGEKLVFNASELGLDKITNENYGEKFYEKISQVISYLLMDCPYELYWYDETQSIGWQYFPTIKDNGKVLEISRLTFEIPVANEYRAEDANPCLMNSEQVKKALAAQKKAADIVKANASASDYEKLQTYKNAICQLTSYNYDVVVSGSEYISPWQLIWVFDGDDSTTVVCEGYAKAFQYLCDLSGLTCYSVSGWMAGGTGQGYHMWNIVTLNNKNYLVDVTNCDEGTIGYPDKLFLAGTKGNVTDGYVFPLAYDIKYIYDEFQEPLLGKNILQIAASNYEPEKPGKWMKDNTGWWYCYSDNSFPRNEWKQIGGKWYCFDSAGYIKYGWQCVNNIWYYLDESGAMTIGWKSIGGQWYYFNGSGTMVTGWQSISGQWYYFSGSGAMTTGWKSVGGQWYYFSGSGAMTTGWQSVGGQWYYMNSSGAMCTGWVCVGNKWYYMNPSSGIMQKGWKQLGNVWYYLKENGEMAIGNVVISGKVYRFSSSGVWLG